MLLEKEFLENLDELLMENWPPILHNLEASWKRKLSTAFYLGKNSTQEKITPEEATKAPYNKGLLIITDSDYEPKYGFYGSQFIPFGGYYRRKLTRKKALDKVKAYNGKIYYISPDREAYKTYGERESRPEDFAPTKKEYQSKEITARYTQLLRKYFNKKFNEFKSFAPSLKDKIKAELRTKKEAQYNSLKDSIYQLTSRTEVLEPTSDDLSEAINTYVNILNKLLYIDVDEASSFGYGQSRETKLRIRKQKHTKEMDIDYERVTELTKELAKATENIKKKLGREE